MRNEDLTRSLADARFPTLPPITKIGVETVEKVMRDAGGVDFPLPTYLIKIGVEAT